MKKYNKYKNILKELSCVRFQECNKGETNYSYFPIIFETENHERN